MKKLVFFLFLLGYVVLGAQSTADTTVYDAPESLPYPLIKSCNAAAHPGWTADSVRTCGEYNLMRLMSQNVQYPFEAREKNIQGTVVIQMVIEPTGRMSQINLLKDIGGGCGAEAQRILKALDTLGLRWQPGTIGGKAVRSRKALPFRFRLTEALPYSFNDLGDTIYTQIDTAIRFRAGDDSLYAYIVNKLEYPKSYKDSCKVGVIEYALLVRANGSVSIDNQLDFSNLGSDFQFNGIRLANRTAGQWEPAMYQGRPVPATTPFRVVFKSDAEGCKLRNEQFDRAMVLADEAIALSDQGKTDEAIKKFDEALALDPNNTELLYYRGTLLLNSGQKEPACVDYNRVKAILGQTWFEPIRKIVCGKE